MRSRFIERSILPSRPVNKIMYSILSSRVLVSPLSDKIITTVHSRDRSYDIVFESCASRHVLSPALQIVVKVFIAIRY